MTQSLTSAGSALLQVGELIGHFVKKWLLGRTPRQAYTVTFMMPKVRFSAHITVCLFDVKAFAQADFGLALPRMSLLATIAPAYSVLSPISNHLQPCRSCSFLLVEVLYVDNGHCDLERWC